MSINVTNVFVVSTSLSSAIGGLLYAVTLMVSCVDGVGVAANALMAVALMLMRRGGGHLGPSGQTLTQQALVDLLACVVSIEYNWDQMTFLPNGPDWLSALICYGWHSQQAFFLLMYLSVSNHIILASERLVAVQYPFHLQNLSSLHYRTTVSVVWFVCCCLYNVPSFFYVSYDAPTNSCNSASYEGATEWLRYFSMSIAFFFFVLPLVLLVVINGLTVRALRRDSFPIQRDTAGRGSTSAHLSTTNDLKRRASVQLLRTSIALTVVFLLAMVYNNVIYTIQDVMGFYFGVTSIENVLGLTLQGINFTLNPFVLFIFLPGIRKQLLSIFAFSIIARKHSIKSTTKETRSLEALS